MKKKGNAQWGKAMGSLKAVPRDFQPDGANDLMRSSWLPRRSVNQKTQNQPLARDLFVRRDGENE